MEAKLVRPGAGSVPRISLEYSSRQNLQKVSTGNNVHIYLQGAIDRRVSVMYLEGEPDNCEI